MKTVDIISLPELLFAHVYKTESYDNYIHASKNHIEITYLSDGELILEQQTQKGSLRAVKGDIICLLEDTKVHADVFHAHHTVCAQVLWDYAENESGLYLPTVISGGASSDTALYSGRDGAEEIRQLIDDFIYNFHIYDDSHTKCACRFMEILFKADMLCRGSDSFKMPSVTMYAEKAKRYIHRNIYRVMTQAEIAEHVGVTPEYLCSIFKKAQGTTIMKYINRAKLDGISELMEREHIPLYKASEMFGFTDPNYVSRLYKQLFGRNITERPSAAAPDA